jgi:all-trans-8'-apo-beta-carotenal 15,15'-oxygenase
MIRPPTQSEKTNLLPQVAKGWRNVDDQAVNQNQIYEFSNKEIQGKIPLELRGTFLRNGPGFNVVYGTQLKHPIDGDGLIVALSFRDGRVFYHSKFVETKNHVEEKKAGKMLYDGNMGTRVPEGIQPRGIRDPAHTNVFYANSKIFALHEYALPHALNPTTLDTIGQDTFDNALELNVMSAHFRYDADLDVYVTVGFKAGTPTIPGRISLYEFDRSLKLKVATRLQLQGCNYAHDFLISPNWYILHASPFIDTRLETLNLVKQRQLSPGETMKYVPGAESQIILVERPTTGNTTTSNNPRIIRLDTEPCHIFHFANCRETKDGIVQFEAMCLPMNFNMDWEDQAFLSNAGQAPGTMQSFRVDTKNGGSLSRSMLPGLEYTGGEFPTTNPFRHCVRTATTTTNNNNNKPKISTRYFYFMASQPSVALPFTDVVKYDTTSHFVSRWHSEGVVGEPCFIPRLGRASAWHGDEDDGWLIVQLYLYKEDRVQFCILDAKKVHQGPMCRINMPWHIPFAFHGTFSEEVLVKPVPVGTSMKNSKL